MEKLPSSFRDRSIRGGFLQLGPINQKAAHLTEDRKPLGGYIYAVNGGMICHLCKHSCCSFNLASTAKNSHEDAVVCKPAWPPGVFIRIASIFTVTLCGTGQIRLKLERICLYELLITPLAADIASVFSRTSVVSHYQAHARSLSSSHLPDGSLIACIQPSSAIM